VKLGQPTLEVELAHLHLVKGHQRMRIGQLPMTLLTDIEPALRVSVHSVPQHRVHQSAEITDGLLIGLLHPHKGMPHGTLGLGAGQHPTVMAEDALLIGSGAVDADGGADGGSSTEVAELGSSSIKVTAVFVELGEGVLVEEVELVTFRTDE
jgi:hypothetical protein